MSGKRRDGTGNGTGADMSTRNGDEAGQAALRLRTLARLLPDRRNANNHNADGSGEKETDSEAAQRAIVARLASRQGASR